MRSTRLKNAGTSECRRFKAQKAQRAGVCGNDYRDGGGGRGDKAGFSFAIIVMLLVALITGLVGLRPTQILQALYHGAAVWCGCLSSTGSITRFLN